MKKKLVAAMAASMIGGAAFAAPPPGTIGVGVAHTESSLDDGNIIFIPVTLENNLWVEPFLSYSSVEDSSGTEVDFLTIGAGLFKDFHATAKTRAYFGGRLGYVRADVDLAGPGGNEDEDGVLVQPVLGFGFEPASNLIFGAEAFVTYQDSDITGTESYGTGTSLFARYFFTK